MSGTISKFATMLLACISLTAPVWPRKPSHQQHANRRCLERTRTTELRAARSAQNPTSAHGSERL